MKKILKPGISLEIEFKVSEKESARHVGSGSLDVFSTPSLVALMEKSAMEAVAGYLEDGMTTVGSLVNIKHIKPSPIGSVIKCAASLKEISGRKLIFTVEASDEEGLIGSGTHERYIIDEQRFMNKIRL